MKLCHQPLKNKIVLVEPEWEYGKELYELIDANRDHLSNLVWAKPATLISTTVFLDRMSTSTYEKFRLITDFDDRILGAITLRDKPGYKELGYWLIKDARNQGVMTRAVELMIKGVEGRISACIKKENIASQTVLLKNGFVAKSYDDLGWVVMNRG